MVVLIAAEAGWHSGGGIAVDVAGWWPGGIGGAVSGASSFVSAPCCDAGDSSGFTSSPATGDTSSSSPS